MAAAVSVTNNNNNKCFECVKTFGHGLKRGIDHVTERILDLSDPTVKFASLIKKIISFVDGVIKAVATGVKNFGSALSHFVEIAEFFSCFSLVWSLAKGAFKEVIEKVSKAFLAVFAGLMSLKFLDSIKLIDLGSVATKIGSIPVFGLIVEIPAFFFGVVAYGLDVVYRISLLIKNKHEKRAADLVAEQWKLKQEIFNTKTEGRPIAPERVQLLVDMDKRIETLRNELLKKRIFCNSGFKADDLIIKGMSEATKVSAAQFMQNISQANLPDNDKTYMKEKLEHENQKWEVMKDHNKIHKNKAWIAIIVNTAKTIFFTFAICAVLGVAALAFTTPLMLTLSVIVAAMQMGKIFYDRYYDKDSMKLPAWHYTRPGLV